MDRSNILRIALTLLIAVGAAFFWWKQRSPQGQGGEAKKVAIPEEEPRIVDAFRELPDALAEATHIGPTGHENNCFSRAYTLLELQLKRPLGSLERELKAAAGRKLRQPSTPAMDRAISLLIERKFVKAGDAALEARDEALRKGEKGTRDVVRATELAGLIAERTWRGGRLTYPQALEHYQAAATLTSMERDFLEWVRVQNHLGRVMERLGQSQEAEDLLAAAIREAEAKTPSLAEHELLLRTRCLLAMAQRSLKKYPDAERNCRTVLQVNERVLGREHPVTLQNRVELSITLLWVGDRREEGDRIHDETYAARKRVLGPEHSDTLLSQMDEAEKLRRLKRIEEAAAEYRAVAEARGRTVGPLEPETRYAWSKLSNYYYVEDRLAECEAIERAQMALQERELGFGNRDTLNSCYVLMKALREQDKIEEARELARRAVVAAKEHLNGDKALQAKILEMAEELEVASN